MAFEHKDLRVTSYTRSSQPVLSHGKSPDEVERAHRNLHTYLGDEFRKLETTIATLVAAVPQVAFKEPETPQTGMIRFAKAPWNPLGTGDGWAYYNGSTWVAL